MVLQWQPCSCCSTEVTTQTILAAIDEMAASEIAQIEQETTAVLQQLAAETEVAAAERRKQARQRGLANLGDELALGHQQARLQAGRIYQQARADLIARVLEEVQVQLHGLRDDPERYRVLYGRLLREALTILEREDGQIVIRADPRDRPLLEAIMASEHVSATAIQYDLDTAGGAIVSNVGDYVVVDNTLETRLERALPQLQQEIAKELGLPQELDIVEEKR